MSAMMRISEINFCKKIVKTTAKVYENFILEQIVMPLHVNLFNKNDWTFQQVCAPAHKSKTTQRSLQKNVPDFKEHKYYPSRDPDLTQLYYKLRSVQEIKICHTKTSKFVESECFLRKAVLEIRMEVEHALMDD
ncbi:putative MhmaT1 transposase [Trichonephila clavipes]|nr:putative MhmaT1 transposase [Trichonephila clavipes]